MPKSINPLLGRRKPSSPLSPARQKKAGASRKGSLAEAVDADERLNDTGIIPSLAPDRVSQDVETLIRWIHTHAWAEIPERAAGMGSERISEVLRFRARLPRMASVAHLHALSVSSTDTERALAALVASATVRKVVVPGRGKGGASVGEGVVLGEDWKTSVREEDGLADEAKEKYVALLDAYPTSATVPTTSFAQGEVQDLLATGYFTSPTAYSVGASSHLFARPGLSSLSPLSQAGTKAAAGTLAAVGGTGAVQESGGGGSILATRDNRTKHPVGRQMTFSLPGTGAYLKLLVEARLHLLAMLKQLSPRYREATRDLLREKWDGNIPNDATSRAKRARGEFTGVLPGKTKKWKDFYGLQFDWVLAECVGGGLVELFDTGSVGTGVRAR